MVLYCIILRDAFNAFSFSYQGALGLCDITISVVLKMPKKFSFHVMLYCLFLAAANYTLQYCGKEGEPGALSQTFIDF